MRLFPERFNERLELGVAPFHVVLDRRKEEAASWAPVFVTVSWLWVQCDRLPQASQAMPVFLLNSALLSSRIWFKKQEEKWDTIASASTFAKGDHRLNERRATLAITRSPRVSQLGSADS